MPNLIKAYRNMSYGPPLVNQKYSPLDRIDFSEANAAFCGGLLTARWRVLNSLGLLPARLSLILPNWEDAAGNEEGNKPPLVVISTNRSNWIKRALDSATPRLTARGIDEFDNASDLRALDLSFKDVNEERKKLKPPLTPLPALPAQPSVPMYSPKRIGEGAGPRNVYVVVHAAEYEEYQTNLEGSGVTVVGWEFRRPRPGAIPICGFGASRFAAIEFCKELRRAAGDPWDYAWLFDDNVVAFTSFPGFLKVEDAIDVELDETEDEVQADGRIIKRKKRYICAGFRGGTKAEAATDHQTWASNEIVAGKRERNTRGRQYEDLPAVIVPNLIQQAALWNIAELSRKKLNFGSIFITSAEDMSLARYFDLKNIPYLFYNGIKIYKEDPYPDGSRSAAKVGKGRAQIAQLIAESEWMETPAGLTPPPPIMFQPLRNPDDKAPFDGREQTLGLFIRKSVIPNALDEIKAKTNDRKTENTAMCQATEQTICRAIESNLVGDPAFDKTFKVTADILTGIDQVSSDET